MSDWAEKSNALVAAYSAAEDIDEAILNMGEQIDRLRAENAKTREILAGGDYGSLPNDWSLDRVAEARMDDINKLTWQVRDTCVRAEKAEAENAALITSLARQTARLAESVTENATLRELVREALELYLPRGWAERAEKALG